MNIGILNFRGFATEYGSSLRGYFDEANTILRFEKGSEEEVYNFKKIILKEFFNQFHLSQDIAEGKSSYLNAKLIFLQELKEADSIPDYNSKIKNFIEQMNAINTVYTERTAHDNLNIDHYVKEHFFHYEKDSILTPTAVTIGSGLLVGATRDPIISLFAGLATTYFVLRYINNNREVRRELDFRTNNLEVLANAADNVLQSAYTEVQNPESQIRSF